MEEELREGYYVKINWAGYEGKFFRVLDHEPFTYETGTSDVPEFDEVVPGGESGFRNISVLEPDDRPMRLFYVVWGVKSGGRYKVKIPPGTDRFGTDEDRDAAYITNEKSPYYDPNPLYAFWLVHNVYPSINFINTTPVTVKPKVWFYGVKYTLEEVSDPEVLEKLRNFERGSSPSIPFRTITIGGVKG